MKYKYTKHKIRKLFKISEQNIYDANLKENKLFALKTQTLLFKRVQILHDSSMEIIMDSIGGDTVLCVW